MKKLFVMLLWAMLLLLIGCSSEPSQITVELPRVQVTATATVLPPTPTLEATLPPPVVASPVPTITALPATAEPTAEPTPDGIVLDSLEDFAAENRNPLTGEIIADPARLARRPLAIKISNAPPRFVRPQSGLNQADIMFEHITEAVVTRFTGIFYSQDPPAVGPIRSARLIDLELPAMYDAALGYSGSSNGVGSKLFASDFASRILGPGAFGYYRTGDTSKPFEHTFYARPEQLRQSLGDLNRPPAFSGVNLQFTSVPPAGGTAATQIDINYNWEVVSWTYDPATNLYYRRAGGAVHVDGNTGEQVRARNIVVPFVNHVDDANICEQAANGVCQLLSVEIQLWGEGEAVIFRDGQRYEGTWKRIGRNDMLTFYDANGDQIPLQIGNTWVQLMSIYYSDPLSSTP